MWLITSTGFFSIVCKPGDAERGTLTIRSRVRSDLDALREYLPSLGAIEEGAGTDYRYRARAKRGDVAKALAKMIQDLDYANFKNEVKKSRGNIGRVSMAKFGMYCMASNPLCRRNLVTLMAAL